MTLLLDMYFLTNLSLRVATTSARSLTPNIFKHSAAVLSALLSNANSWKNPCSVV